MRAIAVEPKAESSPNVFLENLHASRKLETTYYATDRKQLTDFFWYRESGIRVNIGLQNINVVPLYEDRDHDAGGDNEFVLANPNIGTEEKDRFRRLIHAHCRYVRTAHTRWLHNICGRR